MTGPLTAESLLAALCDRAAHSITPEFYGGVIEFIESQARRIAELERENARLKTACDKYSEAEITLTESAQPPQDARLTLFDAIAHGDEKHRAWLKQAIEDHFAGREVSRP